MKRTLAFTIGLAITATICVALAQPAGPEPWSGDQDQPQQQQADDGRCPRGDRDADRPRRPFGPPAFDEQDDFGPNAEGDDQGDGERRPRHRRPPHPPGPLMFWIDTDRNGRLSAAEVDAATATLKKLDKNEDGELTRDELRPPPPPRPDDEDGEFAPEGEGDGRQERGRFGPPPRGQRGGDGDREGSRRGPGPELDTSVSPQEIDLW